MNRRIGAFIALALEPTRVSPNVVSVCGLLVTLAGATIVAFAHRSISPLEVGAVLVIWQFAFSLDCADGQLARIRGQSSPFGAWLDQVLDFLSHTVIFASLTVFAVRTSEFDEAYGAAFGAMVVSMSVLQLFASSQRNALMGTAPALEAGGPGRLQILGLGRHLTDYGATLALAALLLLWPPGLIAFLVVSAVLNGATVAGQIAINWISYSRARDVD
ncbi:MAG: CDP-alcohol phosphatidyltransferase family protein [Chloroflexi bacterium]|nr:CDP-alcohol phosphatidyltransferase family protein [Chloroflexota bacterium]